MEADKKIICDRIYEYINKILPSKIDDEIFTKISLEELGEFYYNEIISSVTNATEELINIVIKAISREKYKFECQKDYYCVLCKHIRIKRLPFDVLTDVEKEYNEVFIQKYNLVIQKYTNTINDINNKLFLTKEKIAKIKNGKPSYSLIRDISTDEEQLNNLTSECNSCNTRKEMLSFAIEYMKSRFADFCDNNDLNSIKTAQRQAALYLCKSDDYDVKDYFSIYREYLDIVEDDIDRSYALFFKIKIYIIGEMARKSFRYFSYTKSQDDAIKEIKDYLSLLPKIDDLNNYRKTDLAQYNNLLEKMISDYRLISESKELLDKSVCLRDRKELLLDAIALYEQNKFDLFNNIVPIQIEGMFANYLKDATTFDRFSRMELYEGAVLRDKIRLLNNLKSDIYPEAVEYFMYYFNNLIRNKIAHGRYICCDKTILSAEVFAKELFLDMLLLIYMLSRKSETEKMYRFIHGYKKYYAKFSSKEHSCYGALFNDMIGKKLISGYDTLEYYRPIQVAYWIVNPYYEKIYEQVEDKSDLLDLRSEFLSKEFWEYVLNELNDIIDTGYDYKDVNMELLSVVNGLFKCEISSETKYILTKVNAALQRIKAFE